MEGATFEYAARRGDTLGNLGRELGVPGGRMCELNPGLGEDEALPPGRRVVVPCPEVVTRHRLRRAGPRVVMVRPCLRVHVADEDRSMPVIPLYARGRGGERVIDLSIRRLLRSGEGTIDGIIFLARGDAAILGGAPVRRYAGDGPLILLAGGGAGREPPPSVERLRRDLEAHGVPVIRRFGARDPSGEARIRIRVDARDLREAGGAGRGLRLRAYATDGTACDTDRSGVIGMLRLLAEIRSEGRTGWRAGVETSASEDDPGRPRKVDPREIGGDRARVEEGEEAAEAIPCPLVGEIRILRERVGTVRRCVEAGRPAIEFARDLHPTEAIPVELLAYVREPGDGLHRLCPETGPATREEIDRERMRLRVDRTRIVLVFAVLPEGTRLEEAWIDGEPAAG